MLRELMTWTLIAIVVLCSEVHALSLGRQERAHSARSLSQDPPMPPKCGNATPEDEDLEGFKTTIGYYLINRFWKIYYMVPLYECTLEAIALHPNITTALKIFVEFWDVDWRPMATTVADQIYYDYKGYPNNSVHWGCNLEKKSEYLALRNGSCIVVTNETSWDHPQRFCIQSALILFFDMKHLMT